MASTAAKVDKLKYKKWHLENTNQQQQEPGGE